MYMGTPIKELGMHVDGWSDVIEDGAELAPKVKKSFNEIMNNHKIPGLRITEVSLTNGEMENRPYLLMTSAPGATIAVRIAPFGKNLVVSWDMYTKRQPNWLTIGLLGGIVFALSLTNVLTTGYYYGEFFAGLFGFISTFLTWLVWPSIILLLLGKVFKDDWLGLFVKDLNPFAADDVDSLSTIIDNALTDAVEDSYEEPEPEPAPEKNKAKK
jgi:hypothetical protein